MIPPIKVTVKDGQLILPDDTLEKYDLKDGDELLLIEFNDRLVKAYQYMAMALEAMSGIVPVSERSPLDMSVEERLEEFDKLIGEAHSEVERLGLDEAEVLETINNARTQFNKHYFGKSFSDHD